jgi:hypothetical protein
LDDPEVKTTVIGLLLSFGIVIGIYGGSVSDDLLPIALGVQVIGDMEVKTTVIRVFLSPNIAIGVYGGLYVMICCLFHLLFG